eukprot:CAMPEP_0170176634 /NCGR_PEP_ID=MMETSP0040_2-20121228/9466_1 /TAXON_ID=641309 /ORGANISM="Lotharella oceanica, Strain CCMP622" /LENGTH=202 /DNA_ID=CAMNT_0010419015 /DNA_START=62 /DNA_END=670 /DNA_ORIENTATION=+
MQLALKAVLALGVIFCAVCVLRAGGEPSNKLATAAIRSVNVQAQCPRVMRTMPGASLSQTRANLNTALTSPASKCFRANKQASVCDNGLVVLRPTMAARAAEKDTSIDADKIIEDLSAKWDKVENKGQVAVYAGGALVALVTANAVVTTIDSLPFIPYFTEVVGTCYSLWFAYKYLLFEDSRKELAKDIEILLEKVGGKTSE